jgi:hypothetical protein
VCAGDYQDLEGTVKQVTNKVGKNNFTFEMIEPNPKFAPFYMQSTSNTLNNLIWYYVFAACWFPALCLFYTVIL